MARVYGKSAAVPSRCLARRAIPWRLSRLAAALEALLNAGVTIIQAWEMAATASGSPAILKAVLAWKPQVEAGQTPSEAVNASSQFPELFANLYHSGEISGQLDDSLRRLRDYYQEEGTRKLHLLAQWVPRFIYFVVAGTSPTRSSVFILRISRRSDRRAGFNRDCPSASHFV